MSTCLCSLPDGLLKTFLPNSWSSKACCKHVSARDTAIEFPIRPACIAQAKVFWKTLLTQEVMEAWSFLPGASWNWRLEDETRGCEVDELRYGLSDLSHLGCFPLFSPYMPTFLKQRGLFVSYLPLSCLPRGFIRCYNPVLGMIERLPAFSALGGGERWANLWNYFTALKKTYLNRRHAVIITSKTGISHSITPSSSRVSIWEWGNFHASQ